jgi:hypothetical protein
MTPRFPPESGKIAAVTKKLSLPVWFAVGLVLCTGCGAEPPAAPPVTLPPPVTSTAPPSPASTAPASTTPATPTTTAGPPLTAQPMTAADGRKTSACRDGSCEVLVSTGTRVPFTTSNGPGSAVVDAIGPEGVVLMLSAGITGQIGSGPTAGEFAALNDVKFTVVAARAGSGVLRLTRGQ